MIPHRLNSTISHQRPLKSVVNALLISLVLLVLLDAVDVDLADTALPLLVVVSNTDLLSASTPAAVTMIWPSGKTM